MDISCLSLQKQCEALKLPLNSCLLPKDNRPELALMTTMRTVDRAVAFCEGGAVELLLYCLCFDRLYSLYRSVAKSRRYTNPSLTAERDMYYVRFQNEKTLIRNNPDLTSQLVLDIAKARECDLLGAFDTLLNWQRQPPGWFDTLPAGCWRGHKWIGVDRELILALFRVLGPKRWSIIASEMLADDQSYKNGWPDLIWVEGKNLGLIEVKTSDKLHCGQIATFQKIIGQLCLPIQVVQVTWTT